MLLKYLPPQRYRLNQTVEHPIEENVLFCLFVGYMFTFVCEGVLRYLFAIVGAANLLYIRDLVMIGLITYVAFVRLIRDQWIHGPVAILSLLLGIHLVIGWLTGIGFFQALFGAKIFLPIILGVAIWPVLQLKSGALIVIARLCFVFSVLGIFINYMYGELPWQAFEYQTAFGMVETTKKWWMLGGISRLAGFQRSSVHAAGIIGGLGSILLAISPSLMMRLIIGVAGLFAIILTTSKGMVLTYGIACLWLIVPALWRSLDVGRWLVAGIAMLSALLPLASVVFDFGKAKDWPSPLLSFWMRLEDMWPSAFALIESPINLLIGNGLGAIGTPQAYGSYAQFQNSADNIFLYFYVTFGLLGYVYLLFPIFSAYRLRGNIDRFNFCYVAFLLGFYGYGLTSNMAEQPFLMTIIGVIYGSSITIHTQSAHASVSRR